MRDDVKATVASSVRVPPHNQLPLQLIVLRRGDAARFPFDLLPLTLIYDAAGPDLSREKNEAYAGCIENDPFQIINERLWRRYGGRWITVRNRLFAAKLLILAHLFITMQTLVQIS